MCIPLHGVNSVKPSQIFTKFGMPANLPSPPPPQSCTKHKTLTLVCASVDGCSVRNAPVEMQLSAVSVQLVQHICGTGSPFSLPIPSVRVHCSLRILWIPFEKRSFLFMLTPSMIYQRNIRNALLERADVQIR
jgi:hypothetical protein